jgi:phosphate starvation-inducible protein PhoH and related proteins
MKKIVKLELEELARQQVAAQKSIHKKLRAQTDNQQDYIDAINECKIITCSGPSGSGKSYIAVGTAVEHLNLGTIDKITLVRPIVECGEKLGALPGNVEEKIDIYMQPFFDIFGDFLDKREIVKMRQNNVIDIQALAYMRGRTLKRSFVILDESQNCSYTQLKMFLTRYGEGSKMVLCGDVSQSDIQTKKYNDFQYVCDLLYDIQDEDIEIVRLTDDDVVRHGLVQKIVRAFP